MHGLDLGALVPAGATVSDVPAVVEENFANFTIDGPGIFDYRFRLDGGPWSETASVDVPIELTNLADDAHRLEVVGMNYAGVWQDEADAVVRTWTVGSPGLPADLTGNGFVDFQDLTILLANWNQSVSAAEGNIVGEDTTPINFQDLTALLAAWTGPQGAASPQAAAAEASVPGAAGVSERDSAPTESRIATNIHFDRPGRRDHTTLRRVNRANSLSFHDTPLRRLQAAAVDRAMAEQSTLGRVNAFKRRAGSGTRR